MKMYKGFDKDLKCRGYQYEIGRTEKEDSAKLCDRGFHACEYPMDVFGYYPPADSRFCEVDLNGVTDETGNDSKRCGTEIKVLAEIGIPGIVKASVDFIMRNIKSEKKKSNTGDRSAAVNSGYGSAAVNSGYSSAATVEGKESVAISLGIKGKAKGAVGCWPVLSLWDQDEELDWHRVAVKSFYVDGETIKADTFYTLNDQCELVEAE